VISHLCVTALNTGGEESMSKGRKSGTEVESGKDWWKFVKNVYDTERKLTKKFWRRQKDLICSDLIQVSEE
jgi:hypothetical protein